MKINKRQLRKIIREERARLMEQPDIPDVMGAIGGGRRYVGPTVPDDMIDRIKAVGRGDLQDHLYDIVDAIESGAPDYTLGILKKNIEDAERMDESRINEMQMSRAAHGEGAYTPVAMAEEFENLADRLFGEIFDAAVTDGMEEEEAAEMAGEVIVGILARSLKNFTASIGTDLERLVR